MTWLPEDVPAREAIELLLAVIAGPSESGYIEVRARTERGMRQHFHAIPADLAELTKANVKLADALLARGQATDVYLGAAPRIERNGGADAINRVYCLWADCDGPEAVAALKAFAPAPTAVIRTGSGDNVHAWWALKGNPHSALSAEWAHRANRRLAYHLGADMRATDPARILRVPGTRNHKHDPPAAVECIRFEAIHYDPRDVVGRLPDPPSTGRPARGTARVLDDVDDALKAIPPDVYVPALTGREVGRDGKVRCPFHGGGEERTPSLHVYEDHWYCFGCDAGGSIIDFGSRLFGLEPRGTTYRELRRELARALLGRQA